MLKNEFEKSINKQRELEQKLNNTTQASEDQNKFKDENNKLKDKLQNLRAEYDEKILTLQMKIDELETEEKLKTELIEDANKVIEDFNDEKHEIKARFKHLMTILEEVDDESSYKEDDEIELEECFDRLEKELVKWMNRKDQRIL
jgi:DNA repair exonuclease SbcCD ATPase subunit